jgi:CMP-N,N'-diacetyllegionaminic acid synthase
VLTHALTASEKIYDETYDVVIMLQPTSPARTATHLEQVVKKLVDENLDAVWTVSETDLKFHPLKQLKIDEEGLMDFFLEEGKSIVARQQLKPIYHRNGICYAFTRECLLNQQTIKGRRTGAIVIEGKIPNIDTVEDLEFAESVIRKANIL